MNNLKSKLLNNLFLPLGDFIFRSEFSRQLEIQREYTYMSEKELDILQQSKLHKLLSHATKTTPFYKEVITRHHSADWLEKFPILTKEKLRTNANQFISSNYKTTNLIKYESSGSTGYRTQVFIDKIEQSVCRAILINWWEWNGYYLGRPLLQTGMTPNRGFIKGIKDYMFSTIYVNAFESSEVDLIRKLQRIREKKGYYLFGYASSLFVLAQIAEKYNINVTFDLAMSQGDKLFDHYQKKIESVFKCKVVEDYGLNEGIMIGQKKALPYFYIYTPSVFLEILDEDDQPVTDGTMGRIIATKLDGYAMPLIRYDTGDLGLMLPRDEYPPDRDLQFPLLKTVVGRNTDIIKTKEGKSLIVHSFTGIFEFFPEILQFQIIQNSVEGITIRYIPSESFNMGVLEKIENTLKERTDTDLLINWEVVSSIPPSKSGKPQIIINNLLTRSLSDQII